MNRAMCLRSPCFYFIRIKVQFCCITYLYSLQFVFEFDTIKRKDPEGIDDASEL